MTENGHLSRTEKVLGWVFVSVLALLPFYAFLSVWAGTVFGSYDLWRISKDVILSVVALGIVFLLYKDPNLRRKIFASKITWLATSYILLHVVFGIWALLIDEVNVRSLVYSFIVNLRPVIILFVAWVLVSKNPKLFDGWKKLLLVPASIVVFFGLMQLFVLPTDFLSHFGYGQATIPSYQLVDQKADFLRLQSTLRGANPLGAYLVIVLCALLSLVFRSWKKVFGLALAALVMFCTYSRSAYLGAIVACGFVIALHFKKFITPKRLSIVACVAALVLAMTFGLFRDNDKFQNVFFHTDEHSQSAQSSNYNRMNALQTSAKEVISEPFGRGPGTAGPASQHNDGRQPRIAENYYLQIGQEVGWIGLAVFVAINLFVWRELWKRRSNQLAIIMLASGVGLVLVNTLSHAWADDTLAYIWWGFAGMVIGGVDEDHTTKS